MYQQEVPNVTETKMLGVTIDCKLSWNPHINQKIAFFKRALMMLQPLLGRMWSPKPQYTRWLYEGVILPMLTYGSAVWGHAVQKATIKHKLSKLQRLGLTAITFVRRHTNSRNGGHLRPSPPTLADNREGLRHLLAPGQPAKDCLDVKLSNLTRPQ
jgi:hypothetical protein